MKKQITIRLGDAATTAKAFIDFWKRAERGETVREKNRLHFENLELLLKTLTPGRWTLLKRLHANGPMSIRALANDLGRDYKNVYKMCSAWKILG
jgi:predicted transcriptional regulator